MHTARFWTFSLVLYANTIICTYLDEICVALVKCVVLIFKRLALLTKRCLSALHPADL